MGAYRAKAIVYADILDLLFRRKIPFQ
ncbi:MAG: hypothetical protein K9W43_14140 [Candidatus Thorarchaeota archaeon]|nr:hypothetical protein [Candidatus Thorarchaeota archaeon]